MITISIETRDLIRALESLGPAVERHLREAARLTAERIRDEARARVARRTGRTAESLVAEESRDGRGYVVYARLPSEVPTNLDLWLEFGTVKMAPRPFLHPSVDLERPAHDRRLRAAIQQAIAEVGGGGE